MGKMVRKRKECREGGWDGLCIRPAKTLVEQCLIGIETPFLNCWIIVSSWNVCCTYEHVTMINIVKVYRGMNLCSKTGYLNTSRKPGTTPSNQLLRPHPSTTHP